LHDDSNTGDITIMKKPFNYPDWRPQKEYRVIIQWRYKGSKLIWIEASSRAEARRIAEREYPSANAYLVTGEVYA
jgi:hypothetical protein